LNAFAAGNYGTSSVQTVLDANTLPPNMLYTVSSSTKVCWGPVGGPCSTPMIPVYILNGTVLSINNTGVGASDTGAQIAIGTLASSSLYATLSASSTLASLGGSCAQAGNIFAEGICTVFAFLFIPSPQVVDDFLNTGNLAAAKFPFSWIYGIQTTYNGLSVSSSTAMTTLSFNLGSLGIGSTTPMGNILPNKEVFSKATIETYISPTLWATFQTLIAAGMWLGFIWFEFNRARHLAKPH